MYLFRTLGIVFSLLCFFSSCDSNGNVEEYRIARDPTWYPLDVMGKDKSILGFMDDLIFAIGNKEDFKVDFYSTDNNLLVPQMEAGNFDAIISASYPSIWTKGNYAISHPLYRVGPVLMVPIDSPVTSIKQMEGKVIGIPLGSRAFDIKEAANVVLTSYENILSALDHLTTGQIDGVVLDAVPAYLYISSFYRGKLKIATPPLTSVAIRLITRNSKQGSVLVDKINHGLEVLKKDGTFDILLTKWNLYNTEKL